MANLKIDLINKIRNDLYYKEMELARLAQHPDMCYEEKVYNMSEILGLISSLNSRLEYVEMYFKEENEPNTDKPNNEPTQKEKE